MTGMEKLKKVWNVVSVILVTCVVIFALLLMGARVAGLQVFNVVSGSMSPNYNVGDLLYVKTVDPDSVKVKDVITFVLNKDLVVATHRVVGIDAQNRYFITKGDANQTQDAAPVHFNNLIGVPVFKIPLLGYVSDFIQHPPGTYIAVGGIALLAAAVFLPDLLKKKEVKAPANKEENHEE